ncbi:MAG: 16S rRNA (adenine(1518)-N(6)/adenine(1519)-N(6))-dimethyltransferase RsmA [Spirochaetaceae bacterium]|jgi:16S rRNA (adenine1518-N6/adenine1519-N6)-dimethyltransferase|nr:16S rRNA (adenine(1518)-N(6)/adenine(1519)-N(6))-dimethyltransferase RsmA [Spirochaetaceae bacterium]
MSLRVNYDSPSALRAFLDEHGLSLHKRFGQNFLISPALRRRLVDALDIQAGDSVWEIGPGLGGLTALLLERGAQVRAFEVDRGFCRILPELFAEEGGFTLVAGDVLKTWQSAPPAPYLLGNLPYTIAAVLIGNLIESKRLFSRMVLTVQQEVAERILAGPGSKSYSSLAVLCASVYTVKALPVMKPASFYPIPHVNSRGIRFDQRTDYDPAEYPVFFPLLVRHLFSARRKTIKNNLSVLHAQRPELHKGIDDAAHWTNRLLETCHLSGSARVEELSLHDFLRLAQTINTLS